MTKQSKAKQNKTTQNKTKQNKLPSLSKAKQNKTKQNKLPSFMDRFGVLLKCRWGVLPPPTSTQGDFS
jgi:hypothetical protein